MKKEEKTPKKKNKAVFFIIIAFAAIYIPSFFHWIYGDKVETAVLMEGSIEESISAQALIVRDEEVIKSPFTGRCIISVAQGEKAASGQAIATLLKDSSVAALDDLRKKDIEILNAKNEKAKAQEIFSEDISRVESDISAKIKQMVLKNNSGDAEATWSKKQDIDKLIGKKADILGGTGGTDAKIQQLTRERDQLQSVVNSYTKQVYASIPGLVSYSIDGLEGALTIDKIANLTVNQFESLKPVKSEVNNNAISAEQDKALFKLIKGIDQYIVAEIPANKASYFEVGKTTRNIRMSQTGKTYQGVVFSKSNPTDGKCLITFKTEQGLHETTLYRSVNVEIIEKASTGLKIPTKSLLAYDKANGTAKVMFLKANNTVLKNVSVIEANEEYAVIESSKDSSKGTIALYDYYLVNPQNIQEGQMITK